MNEGRHAPMVMAYADNAGALVDDALMMPVPVLGYVDGAYPPYVWFVVG